MRGGHRNGETAKNQCNATSRGAHMRESLHELECHNALVAVPAGRIRVVNAASSRPSGQYVLYWMTAFRRLRANFALEHAVACAMACERPLVILEALRCDYPWASDRLHGF